MKTIDDIVKNAHVLTLPMITRFRGIIQREALVFEGPKGWGEFSPFPEYSDSQCIPWLESALEAAYRGFTVMKRSEVSVNITVPAFRAEDIPEFLARYGISSAPTVKIKVAEGGTKKNPFRADGVFREALDRDLKRTEAVIRYVAEKAGTGLRFRVDPNGAWTYEQAVVALEALAALAERLQATFEYAEQPVSAIQDMIRLKSHLNGSGIFLAADENIRRDFIWELRQDSEGKEEKKRGGPGQPVDDLRRAADVIIVKSAPLGGNRRALKLAHRIGMPAVVSSALDTGIGLYSGLRLAAAMDRAEYACGLNTGTLFREDIVTFAETSGGTLIVPQQCPVPNRDKLRRHRADSGRQRWWLERVRRVYSHMNEKSIYYES